MAVKTEFSKNDFEDILANYDLGDLESFSPLSAGTVQTNFLIHTDQGKWIFKYYENRPLESVQFEANALVYIGKHDFPCALPILDKHGATVGTHRDKPYIIFNFLEGYSVEQPNLVQQRQIIHTAARLQTITTGYLPPLREFRWNYTPELCFKLARIEAEKIGTDSAYQKADWYEQELQTFELPDTLPKGICHCDFDSSNILFEGDQMTALLDFDDANYTYLLFDLVNLIDGWAWPFGGDFDPDYARQIVQTYMEVRPLSELERKHLFDVHKLQIFVDGIWFFARGTVGDFYEQDKLAHLDYLGRQFYIHEIVG